MSSAYLCECIVVIFVYIYGHVATIYGRISDCCIVRTLGYDPLAVIKFVELRCFQRKNDVRQDDLVLEPLGLKSKFDRRFVACNILSNDDERLDSLSGAQRYDVTCGSIKVYGFAVDRQRLEVRIRYRDVDV